MTGPSDRPTREELEAEVARLRSEVERRDDVRFTRARSVLAVVLVVLASISLVASTVAVWLHERVFDTESFMELVDPVFTDPAVTDAIGDRIGDEVIVALQLQARFEETLGALQTYLAQGIADALELTDRQRQALALLPLPDLTDLAEPLASGIETRIRQATDALVRSDVYQQRLPELVADAHGKAVALVREDYEALPNLVIDSGEVRLNLVPIVADAMRNLADRGLGAIGADVTIPEIDPAEPVPQAIARLSQALGVELPEDFGQVTVMSQSELEDVQAFARTFDRLVWALIGLTVVLAVAAILVSHRRRRTVVQLALGGAIGLLVAWSFIRVVQNRILDAIVDPGAQEAAGVVVGNVLGSLRTTAIVVTLAALVVGLAAHLAGNPGWLRWVRGHSGGAADRFVADHHDLLRVAGVGLAILTLFVVGISWLSVLLIAAAVALYLWFLAVVSGRTSNREEGEQIEVG